MAHPANTSLDVIVLQDRIRELEAKLDEVWKDLEEARKERDQYLSELMYLENGESM